MRFNHTMIFFKLIELALSIILKQRELYESKHNAVECRCSKNIRLVILFDMLLNPGFKMTTIFANIARTTASTRKFIHQGRFQIIRNWVFIWKIIFNFELAKNKLNVKIFFTKLVTKFPKFSFDMVWKVVDIW